jgi:NADP-dependent 3-hydroxy acid dehydrogenase YdfG
LALIVITGASSGIGKSVAEAFRREGHPLLLIARHVEPKPPLDGPEVRYARVDVADFAAVEGAVREAEQEFGGTGCLVNSAGTADARDFLQVEPESYRREIETNLLGVLNCIKAVLAGMVERGAGTIINISSVSDRKTAPVAITYTATKYGVRALTESLREDVAKSGVRVINVAPAYVKTNIHQQMGISFEEYRERLGNPDFMSSEELAEIILFCWRLPPQICIRDIVVAPTRSFF